uniref:EF-hand domain-containing protein n=1 Tax=Gossypium raimondii TaxID=29730 RepID=A0A0D2UCS4_GOSRA|nr:hypothetical protein B456_010G116800 [Gossypium raimondii]
MASLTSLKRSSPSILHLSSIHQRLQIRQFSSLPLINASNIQSNNKKDSIASSFLKWIAVGSSFGLVCWYSFSASDRSTGFFNEQFLSFADWSTETAESAVDGSKNSFRKLALPDYSSKFIFGEEYRRKVFFNYEKRLRLRSPPEKVFEYFASFQTPEGELLMRPADLMRAIVPVFPPSESHLVRDGYLSGERSPGELRCDPSELFMLFDMDTDGLISFKEYIFFVTLLSIPESSFSIAFKMFDVDNNEEIDKEEFKKVMALMRANNRQGAVHRDGLRTGLKVTGSVEDGGLVEYFFGKDGKARLQHDKFIEFMRKLQDEVCGISLTDNIVEIIFHVFDTNRDGHLSSDEFVRVLLKRERDIAQPVESGIFGLLSCCWHCSNNSSIGRVIT